MDRQQPTAADQREFDEHDFLVKVRVIFAQFRTILHISQLFLQVQRDEQIRQKDNVADNELVIVYDGSTVQDITTVKTKMLNFALWGIEKNKWHYFDVIATTNRGVSCDWRFVKFAFNKAMEYAKSLPNSGQWTKLRLWSDGGLKGKENLLTFAQYQVCFSLQFDNTSH